MQKKFLVFGLLSELLYLCFYLLKALSISWGVEKFYLKDNRVFLIALGIMSLLFIFYILAAKIVKKCEINFKTILYFSIFFNFSLLFVWNISTDDLFTYIYRGRLLSEYGANPYIIAYDYFKFDKFYQPLKTIWSSETAIYGPAFTLIGAFLNVLGRDNVIITILLFRLLFAVSIVVSSIVVYKITGSTFATFLYSWNPVILFELGANDHIDGAMILFFSIGLFMIFKSKNLLRAGGGLVIIVISALVKYFTAVLFPLLFIYVIKRVKERRTKLSLTVTVLLISGIVILLTYLPFIQQTGIFERLLAVLRADLLNPSLGVSILKQFFDFKVASKIAYYIFLVGYVFIFLKALTTRELGIKQVLRKMFYSYSLFFLLFFSLILPWYLTSLIFLTCLYCAYFKNMEKYVYLITFYSFALYFIVR